MMAKRLKDNSTSKVGTTTINKALTPTLTKVVPDEIDKNTLSFDSCKNCEMLRGRAVAPHRDVSRIHHQIIYFNINRRGVYNPSSNPKTNPPQFEREVDKSGQHFVTLKELYEKFSLRNILQIFLHNIQIYP